MEATATDRATIDYKNELLRKSIHFCSLLIPIIYYFISRDLALMMLVPVTLFSLVLDMSRHYFRPFNLFFNKWFGAMLREHEKDSAKKNLSGASYVFISATLVVFIFPKLLAMTGFTILIISDISAALIGRKFGKHKFLKKSFEGTFAFFVSACVVVLAMPKIEGHLMEYVIGFTAAAVGAIAENLSYGWADDNLTIPLSVGLTMWILYLLLFPDMQLILANVPV